jgi:flavin reductase (DIM6/NTAB) family NADH-FMN oxidoreductase RutF
MKKSLGPRTLVYPTPVWVIGSYGKDGKPNMMTAAWGGICCSQPPCVAVSLQKPRYTYVNIMEQKAFTVSIPPEKHLKEADYAGLVSGRDENKFEITRLTPVRSELVHAPFVQEFPIVLECKLLHSLEIGLHTLFVGEILDVKAEDNVLGADGMPDILKVKPLVFDPGQRGYYGIGSYLGQAFTLGQEFSNEH